MIELYLAILLFGLGSYLKKQNPEQNKPKPISQPGVTQPGVTQPGVTEPTRDVITVSDNRYFEKDGENLYVYEKNTRDKIKALEDKYGKQLDQQCKTIAPRDFLGLLDDNSKDLYEKRRLDETSLNLSNVSDSEVLKYEPKKNQIVSKLTGTEIPITDFTNSKIINKDGEGNIESLNNTWAIPYFGSSANQPMKEEAFQNRLETFTGTAQYDFHKKEIKPFFVPSKNTTFVNGSPVNTDLLQSRFNQSNNRTNELPFESELVARGVGKGYKSTGTGGFHQFEINDIARPKNVDELRVLSNPKVTYKRPVLSGKGVDKRSKEGNVRKYRPDKFYIANEDHLFRTTGAYTAVKSDEKFIMKTPGRTTSRQIVGAAAPAVNKRPTNIPNFKKSTRNKYSNTGVRNTYVAGSWNANDELSDYGKRSIKLAPNERDTTKKTHITNLVDAVKAIIAPLQDKMKMTRKENIEGNPNPEGYMSADMPKKQTIYDPNDVARTTIKETTIHNSHDGHMKANMPEKQTIYDPNDVARTTIKEQTIHNKMHTHVKGPTKLTVYDPNDLPKTTIKETTIHNNHYGHLHDQNAAKRPTSYDILPPKTTVKETTIDNIHHTNVSYSRGDGKGYLVTNYDAPATQKQSTSDNEYSGNISSSINDKGGYLSSNFEAPATQKQSTSDNEYTGSAGSSSLTASKSYSDAYNAHTNSTKEVIAKGRAPTQTGVKVVAGTSEQGDVVVSRQNATINYSDSSVVSNVISAGTAYNFEENSHQTSPRVQLSNEPNIERTNPQNLNPLKSNPYVQFINGESDGDSLANYLSQPPTDTEDENFI